MKLTKRKGFNFFRSYFDVYNELETPEDKLAFIDALLQRQFLGIKPDNLKGMARFAYISQTNSIDSQVKGYEDKTKTRLDGSPYFLSDEASQTPLTDPPCQGVKTPPTEQVQEKGEVEEKEQQQQERKIFVDSYDEYKNEIARVPNTTWIENFYSTFKLKDKTLSKVMDDFIKHKRCLPGPPPNNINDFKIHFYNWCLKVDPFGKLDAYKKHKPKEKGAI